MKRKAIITVFIISLLALGGAVWYYLEDTTLMKTANNEMEANKKNNTGAVIPGYNQSTGANNTSQTPTEQKKPAAQAQGTSNVDTIVNDLNTEANSEQYMSKESDSEANAVNSDQNNFNFNYESQF